jgi:hypothetical protein
MVKRLGFWAAVVTLLAVADFVAKSRAQMLSCVPEQPCGGPIPPGIFLSKEDYMRSVLQRWTPVQVNAWQSIDSPFRGWVAVLMWRREQIKDIERRTGGRSGYDPYFRLDMPANCQLSPFVEPMRNPSDPVFRGNLRYYFSEVQMLGGGALPSSGVDLGPARVPDYWVCWEQIEPTFRNEAESEMYEQHYQLLWVRARLAWWKSNAATIERCIEANRARPLTQAQSVTFASEVVNDNKAIDAKWDGIIKGVRDAFAPRQEKPEKIESLEGMREIEKYEHDMDRSQKAEPSPSPHENSHTPE